MKNLTGILIGADPELFLNHKGKIISAIGKIGGKKNKPKFISDEGHAIQEDNIMVEFNIPPSETEESFIGNINFVKDYLETAAKLLNCKLDIRSSAEIDPSELSHPKAQEFGCESDYNVYLRAENPRVNNMGNMRCCGGHIHVGYDNPDQETTEKIVIAMDLLLGLESLLLDSDDQRRTKYGKAGAFRFKPYGFEYRTLSNFWIANDELMSWAWTQTNKAINLVRTGAIDDIATQFSKQAIQAINTNDIELAKEILEQIKQVEKVNA